MAKIVPVEINDLYTLAVSKWEDAKILLANNRYAGAVYNAGYVIELLLKRHIAKRLDWSEYPPFEIKTDGQAAKYTSEQFKNFIGHSIKDLSVLAGMYSNLMVAHKDEFNYILQWSPTMRYNSSKVTKDEAEAVLNSVKIIANYLSKK
ncbi:hypothetical protein A3C89_04295 [Candidatus Kaiserbacteria bacterium RIFCSPHIGHO2_02_FULL_50_50]|uniref:HEPN domain-containing protein n=1 Tax=Candidatus Kaiserbacteria bacterium RIFCSPHIGHO2_02_FULL_50_50 TaxID=1798492 RepID=A0A1F6DDJ3_9BACT|nr:MAG: hypothetical protein A3C89_04295 [Candidatus Kaiserbacteria bacterium RIFCSPHIGHO2_02_FULL_50_50]OGG88406.1 MAG: hypothetical protein A3G62_02285 [Candidatus Kaiserbacteria bacterium RIFCSPLOWO2_12_FULL_50_10]